MVYKFFDEKTGSGAIATSRAGVSVNEQLAEELHKPVTKKFKRRKVYARFKDNIWAADLAEMESLSSKNKNVKYLLCDGNGTRTHNHLVHKRTLNHIAPASSKEVLDIYATIECGFTMKCVRGMTRTYNLLCVIGVFTKYAWVKPLKNKKGKTVLNGFIKIVNESNRKPNKSWVDQGREFYNRLMQE